MKTTVLTRLYALILCAALCISFFSACGNGEESATAALTETAPDTADTAEDTSEAPASGPELKDCPVQHEEEFGGSYILCTIDDFNSLGFEYGDSVTVAFSNGYVMEDIPYYNGYYTQIGEPLLIAYPGYPYIKAAINNGDDLFEVASLSETDTATVTVFEREKYLPIQDARNITYEDIRELFDSDEIFANFRAVKAGDIKENILYRSASPCDNQHNRATYVNGLIKEAGVAFILDLADSDARIRTYFDDPDFSCDYFRTLYDGGKVEPIALNMNLTSDGFKEKLVGGLTKMANAEGPYLVHCTEGKDRTGFVCLLLEALCGATYEEIVDDYMITYDNYYGINENQQRERYDVTIEAVLDPMIRIMAGTDDITFADLAKGAEEFLTGAGMDKETVSLLRDRLTGK